MIEPPELQVLIGSDKPYILAHWHGDEMSLIHLARRYKIATITSTSKDGELMDFVLHRLGAVTSRGSSTRGAVNALKGLLRLMKQGHSTSFAVDGPKGPIHKVKPGVFEVSRLLSAPIFYCGVHVDRAWRFPKSWNQGFLPKPFAKLTILWSGPMPAVTKGQDPRDPKIASELEAHLHAAKQQVAKAIVDS